MHGVPDRLIVLPGGKVGFAEMKRFGGRTSKLQDNQIKFLQSLDHVAGVVDRIEFIEPFIQAIQNQKQVIR